MRRWYLRSMKLDVSGPFDDLRAVVATIASVVAGGPVELKQVAFEALPDSDGFGGTHAAVFEAPGVRVHETIQSGQYGSPRDGFGYDMSWRFEGTGAREGARAAFSTGNYEPKVLSFAMDVSDAEGEAMVAALERLLGRAPRRW